MTEFTASNIVNIIITAFKELLSGGASAIVTLFKVLFMNATEVEGVVTYSGISEFGIWTLSFIGIGVALVIFRRLTHKVVK